MKVLCPIDFSDSSINAAKWITAYLDALGGGAIEFLHCINLKSRSGMFLKMDDMLTEWAERDIKDLMEECSKISEKIDFKTKIVVLDPKSFIPVYAGKESFDWIVVGTKGLTSLKDITVGSVTEYLANKASVPVVAVPHESQMRGLNNLIFGIDENSVLDHQALRQVAELCLANECHLRLVHFKQNPKDPDITAPDYLAGFEGLSWEYEQIESMGDLVGVFNTYCEKHEADMLCLVHHRRNWWRRIFTKSLAKSELFSLKVPLLVITSTNS